MFFQYVSMCMINVLQRLQLFPHKDKYEYGLIASFSKGSLTGREPLTDLWDKPSHAEHSAPVGVKSSLGFCQPPAEILKPTVALSSHHAHQSDSVQL